MRRFIQVFIFCFITASLIAQDNQLVCKLGFSFQISKNDNWGLNEPVVTEVVPGSPACESGLKVNDIILEVNGNGTFLKPAYTIMEWFDDVEASMSISIRNFESSFKQMVIKKDCRMANAISEIQLTPVFAFYSLEDVQDREFVIPIKTNSNPEADFYNYRTYDFASYEGEFSNLDERINAIFIRVLSQMGLKQDKNDPDFIIQTHYSYQSNPSFNPDLLDLSRYSETWRFDVRNNNMVKLPLYDPTAAVRTNDVMYDLEFGFRFYDRKFIEPGKSVVVYESEVKEKLKGNYPLLDYLEMNLPLILIKFPYSKNESLGKYRVKFSRFNYTGISYDINDLKTIVYVAPDSPAAKAGIVAGDVVTNVRGYSFKHNSKNLTESYRRFIAETMKYRDPKTKYTDSSGFSNAMFWDISYYYDIAKEFDNKKKYNSGFTYLFSFNQYIDWEIAKSIPFEVKRKGASISFDIVPELRRHSQILVE